MKQVKDIINDPKVLGPKKQLERHKTINEILANSYIKPLIKKYKITEEDIEQEVTSFLAYIDKIQRCDNCPGLASCTQSIRGKKPVLEKDNEDIVLSYEPCSYQINQDKIDEKNSRLHLHGINPAIFENIDPIINSNRQKIITKIEMFIRNYPKKTEKGIFLSGKYGSGKTYLFSYLTEGLVNKGVEVYFVYYPDFVRKIKSLIGTRDFEEQIEELKTAEVLMLDDLGGETNTTFIRDEVIGPILNERMVFSRPTFITSNLNLEQLVTHFSETSKDVDLLKAERIRERINTLMEFIELKDKNYRS